MNYIYADTLASYLQKFVKGLHRIGSLRRKEEVINDIDFVTKRDLHDIINDINHIFDFEIHSFGNKFCNFSIRTAHGMKRIDVWRADDDNELKRIRTLRTLDKGHFIGLRKKANQQGLTLSEKGLYEPSSKRYINFKNKRDLYNILG